jgi:putative transposase
MPNFRRVRIKGGTYFFTLVTNQRKCLFLLDRANDLFLEALQYVRSHHHFSILAYCILPDHIHMLWKMPINDADYSLRIGEIKKRFSKNYIIEFGNPHTLSSTQQKRGETGIWQKRFWEHYIRNEEDLNRHIDYIHYNPIKHGLVNQIKDWSASSFFDYVNQGYYDSDWGQIVGRNFGSHIYGE